jgi:anti-anti-sigma regulatory factor
MKNGGGNLKLSNLSEKIKGVLAITKLNNIFDSHKTVDEAVKSF